MGSRKSDNESRWDESFRSSRSQLERLGQEALAEHQAGKTRKLTPSRVARNVQIDIAGIKPCECLRGLRYREALTQKEMAAKIGVTQSALSAMERGKRPIGKDLAKKIADIFGGSYKSFAIRE